MTIGVATERILVQFHGEGSGIGELTWPQRGIWKAMTDSGRSMALGRAVPVRPGRTVEEVVTMVRFLLNRHQALRTTVTFAEDGHALQRVHESGEFPLEVVDAGDDADPAAVAETVRARYEDTIFDYVHEWPVRMAVVRQHGRLTHFISMYCHLAVDGHGIAALLRDLSNLDYATGRATAPVRGLRPLELAAQETTPKAKRHNESALRYWERVLRSVPLATWHPLDRSEPFYREVVFDSPAMWLAVRAVATRTGADTGHVLQAAFAVALARITGLNPSVAQLVANNRFRPGFADSVSHLTELGICAIDVADASFTEVVRRAWRASVAAYKYGYFDVGPHQELLDRMALERGAEVKIWPFLNDQRMGPPAPARTVPEAAEIRAALPRTTVRQGQEHEWYDGVFYLHLDDAPDAIRATLCTSTHHLPAASLEAFAHEFERSVVEAALL